LLQLWSSKCVLYSHQFATVIVICVIIAKEIYCKSKLPPDASLFGLAERSGIENTQRLVVAVHRIISYILDGSSQKGWKLLSL
jgi:hypothetical protein